MDGMRSFRLPTASSLDRALACPQSCALPAVDSQNDAADRGTAIHRFIELITNGVERAYALEAIEGEARDFCEQLDIRKLDIPAQSPMFTEISLAWDYESDTARQIGRGRSSYVEATDTEVCGTADLIAVRDGVALVRDYKTGHAFVTPAERNSQLHFLGMAAATVFAADTVLVEVMYVREPSPFGDRFPSDQFWMTGEHRESIKGRILGMVSELMSDDPPFYREGMHCRHCPSWDWCPPKAELLKLIAGTAEFEPAVAYQKTRELEARARTALARIKEHTDRNGPIEVAPGRFYGRSPSGKYEEHTR